MWIEKTETGKYKYVERYNDPLTGKSKKVSVTLDTNRNKDVNAAREALRRRIEARVLQPVKRTDITLKALCEAYTKAQKETVKAQTAYYNERKLRTVQKLLGEDTLISALNAPYVRRKLSAERPETYNERLTRFKALMRWAYREELVTDISYLDKLPRAKAPTAKEKDKDKYLERDELKKLLDSMKVEDWQLLTRFLALSGLRIGEALALNEDDVDFQTRRIRVCKTLVKDTQTISTPKTETSTRFVSMQDELRDCCLEIVKRKWNIARITGKHSDLFFPDPNRGFICYDVYAKYFRETTERVIGRRLTPHALRHTHVALLAESGIPLDVISRRLGHANSEITKDIYFHVTKRLAQKDADMLKKIKIV